MKIGKIIQSLSGFYDVISDGKIYRTRARGNFRKRNIKPLVGDLIEFKSTNSNDGYVLKVLKRRNQLLRPLISNVDQAIVVTSVKQPDFSFNLLDRQLIALAIQHIQPIIYFTKTDLINDDQFHKIKLVADYYLSIGYIVILSRESFMDSNLKRLKDNFKNKEVTVMGQTGAGKSTLLNHIMPDLNLKTGVISKSLHRGKHTTRRVALLNINNGLVADTPGFSSYEALNIDYRHLKDYFPEFVNNENKCRFRECLHVKEPHCAIKSMVDNGEIMKSRYDDYIQLFEGLKNQKPIYNKKK
ncbi:putative ribosome biogenesis GTPase RsgA 1 [Philodulcilactobacillus myokoensis]|uniref:Small ribosomal subunit biogenesis GTPase RsgA n=1 Tax=Philodulcilactobacillus myokoensis TaxID=2929573 RepID=A0A9W6B1R5_9LACO|nr:ribosome small subunit-dependent GTPase A [Philodulcilactobacillus myokoensis]GLB46813.1 putative ribosome biogenesis GTPase RsgA 1 [Philodulcilactobacillus myokoensis]